MVRGQPQQEDNNVANSGVRGEGSVAGSIGGPVKGHVAGR